jgi:hypothetical protein
MIATWMRKLHAGCERHVGVFVAPSAARSSGRFVVSGTGPENRTYLRPTLVLTDGKGQTTLEADGGQNTMFWWRIRVRR